MDGYSIGEMNLKEPAREVYELNIFKTNKMKTIKNDLEVDYIGGDGSLTIEEEKSLSEFLLKRKIAHTKYSYKKSKALKSPKTTS